jgi:hypothetical protein
LLSIEPSRPVDISVRNEVVAARTGFMPGMIAFVGVTLIGALSLFLCTLHLTGGHFSFSLDDPYIHLALAERIRAGHYGLNLGEASSPSSSILYPFLLAAFIGFGQWAALAVNVLATATSMALFVAIGAEAGIDFGRIAAWRLVAFAIALLLGLNLLGVAFTGLEHALHVADTLTCLLGILRLLRTGRMPLWLPLVLVLNPLIRFEGLSIWGTGIIILWLEQKRVAAIVTLVVGVALVGGFSAYLHHLGLPLLPSSILVKSRDMRSAGVAVAVIALINTCFYNLIQYGAPQLLIAFVLIVRAARDHFTRRLALFAGLPIVAHFFAGAFGWFSRYEIYILALALGALAVLYGDLLVRWLTGGWRGFAAGLAVWLGVQAAYAKTTFLTPYSSEAIYLEQYQMHRFAQDFWRAPVAVNDLGWVSYGNSDYVLDLFGLGSEAARLGRLHAGRDPSWMERLVQQHHVDVAMIFPEWFRVLPPGWTPVATLSPNVANGVFEAVLPTTPVTIYATSPQAVANVKASLARFAPTLPPGTILTLN